VELEPHHHHHHHYHYDDYDFDSDYLVLLFSFNKLNNQAVPNSNATTITIKFYTFGSTIASVLDCSGSSCEH